MVMSRKRQLTWTKRRHDETWRHGIMAYQPIREKMFRCDKVSSVRRSFYSLVCTFCFYLRVVKTNLRKKYSLHRRWGVFARSKWVRA